MTHEQHENRKERAENEPLVIARTDEGFRVYSPSNRIRSYIVSGSVQTPSCTCPDFQYHDGDASWRCKHILGVLAQYDGQFPKDACEDEERRAIQEEGRPQEKQEQPSTNGTAQMLLKRSVSPDGRIDSLSVEFSCAVDEQSAGEITSRAGKMLALQARIIERFLGANGAAKDERSGAEDGADGSVPARMLNIGGMDGKWGRRLFINVQADDQTLKLFGNSKQLADAITAAGFSNLAEKIAEGVQLNLPCRVVTKPSRTEGSSTSNAFCRTHNGGETMIQGLAEERKPVSGQTPYLSYSRINRYLHCPEQYRLYYVENLRLRFLAASLVFGQIVHRALAGLFQRKEDPVKLFLALWEQVKDAGLGYGQKESWEKFQASGQALLGKFLREELPRIGNVAAAEKSFELRITSLDLPFVGVIDLIADVDGKRTVVDFKTANAAYQEHEAVLSDQLTAYQLAEPEVEQTALCVLVKTKELAEFLVKADYVAHDIGAGRFYKRPGKWCSWCDFLAVCLKDEKKIEQTLVKIAYSK